MNSTTTTKPTALPSPGENAAPFQLRKPWIGTGGVLGVDEQNNLVIACWVPKHPDLGFEQTLVKEGDEIKVCRLLGTEPERGYSLLISDGDLHVMCNGGHSLNVFGRLRETSLVPNALSRTHLDLGYFDDRHFTQRWIAACSLVGNHPEFYFYFQRKAHRSVNCLPLEFMETAVAGKGRLVTEYSGDPPDAKGVLQPFWGEPVRVPLRGDARKILDVYWDTLNPDTRHQLLIKTISLAKRDKTVILVRDGKKGDQDWSNQDRSKW